jgi:hypothetical protein
MSIRPQAFIPRRRVRGERQCRLRVARGGAALLLVVHGTAIGAQTSNAPDIPGHFLTREAVAIASARRGCLELGDSTYTPDVRQIGACISLGFKFLGVAGGTRWYSSRASRRWLFNDPPKGSADTVVESELVLFRAIGDSLLAPVWHYSFEPEELRSVTPQVVAASDGVLVSIDECVNGTGGCSQTFLLRRGGTWRNVRLSFLDSLNRRFPGAINHGYHVDVRTLRASAAVYSREDANCCPSRVAEMRLRLRGEALEIIQLRIRSND